MDPIIVLVYDAIATFILFLLLRLLIVGLQTEETSTIEKATPIRYFLQNWQQWLVDGLWYYGVSFGVLGLYMIWSKFAFGTFSPVSGQIKRWWGSLSGRVYGGTAKNFLSFFGISFSGDSNAWHPVSTVLGDWGETLYGYLALEDVWRYVVVLALFAVLFYCLLLIHRKKARTAPSPSTRAPSAGKARRR